MFSKKVLVCLLVVSILFIVSCEKTIENKQSDDFSIGKNGIKISSPAFEDKGDIPKQYTCQGEDLSPPLLISDVPENAQSLVLIIEDPDATLETWNHWIIFNMPVETETILEGIEPEGISGRNSWDKLGYGGPCPPGGEHRYFFRIYALDKLLDLEEGASKLQLKKEMEDHIIDQTELMGKFKR